MTDCNRKRTVTLNLNWVLIQMEDAEFGKVLDRVATSTDGALIRDNILLYLQVIAGS